MRDRLIIILLATTLAIINQCFFPIGELSKADALSIAEETCWRNYCGNAAHNGAAINDCGPKSAKLKQVWKYAREEEKATFLFNIIADENGIYAIFTGFETFVVCLDAKTGNKKWETKGMIFLFGSMAGEPGKIFYGNLEGVSCLSTTKGTKNWTYGAFDPDKITGVLYQAKPVAKDGKVYFSATKKLFCVGSTYGNKIWEADVGDNSLFPPCVTEDKVFHAVDNKLYCLDIKNGAKLWTSTLPQNVSDSISYDSGKIFFLTTEYDDEDRLKSSNVCCIDGEKGNELWKVDYQIYITAPPSIKNGNLYLAGSKGIVYCLDASSGAKKWESKISGLRNIGHLSLSGNYIFLAYNSSSLAVLNAKSGNVLSNMSLGSPYFVCQPAFYDDKMFFFDGKRNIYCYEAEIDNVPAKISIKPENPIIMMGESIQLKGTLESESGNEIEGKKISWSSEPKENGKITQDGMFTGLLPGSCTVKATFEKVSATTEVYVKVDKPIVVEPKELDFGETEEDLLTEILTFKNPFDFKVDVVLEPSESWVEVAEKAFSIEGKGEKTVVLKVSTETLEAGKNKRASIEVKWGFGTAFVLLSVKKKEMSPPQFTKTVFEYTDVKPEELKEETLTVTNANKKPIQIKFTQQESWFDISEKEFALEPGETKELKLTVRTDGFKYEEIKTAKIDYEWNKGKGSLDVTVKMIKDIFPPYIAIDEVKPVLDLPNFTITGNVEVGSLLSVWDEDTKESFEPKIDGATFKVTVKLKKAPSITTINIEAKDAAGNATNKKVTIANNHAKVVRLQVGSSKGTVDGSEIAIDPPPTIIKGVTMVPLRAIAEIFGAEVSYEAQTKKITVKLGESVIELFVGQEKAKLNGVDVMVSPPPTVVKGKTMVPFRFIAEALGAQVSYDKNTKEITITKLITP